MTFQDLQLKLGRRDKRTAWHRHLNGEGWVENDCNVADTVYVGQEAIVLGGSTLSDEASIRDHAMISNSCLSDRVIVSENASISGGSIISDKCNITGNAVIFRSNLADNIYVLDNAKIHESCLTGNITVSQSARILNESHVQGRGSSNNIGGSTTLYGAKLILKDMGMVSSAFIYEDADIETNKDVMTLSGFFSSAYTLTCYKNKSNGITLVCNGSKLNMEQFSNWAQAHFPNEPSLRAFLIEFIKVRFSYLLEDRAADIVRQGTVSAENTTERVFLRPSDATYSTTLHRVTLEEAEARMGHIRGQALFNQDLQMPNSIADEVWGFE